MRGFWCAVLYSPLALPGAYISRCWQRRRQCTKKVENRGENVSCIFIIMLTQFGTPTWNKTPGIELVPGQQKNCLDQPSISSHGTAPCDKWLYCTVVLIYSAEHTYTCCSRICSKPWLYMVAFDSNSCAYFVRTPCK